MTDDEAKELKELRARLAHIQFAIESAQRWKPVPSSGRVGEVAMVVSRNDGPWLNRYDVQEILRGEPPFYPPRGR